MRSFFITPVKVKKCTGKLAEKTDLSPALSMRELRLERIFEKRKICQQKGSGSKSLDVFNYNFDFFYFCLFDSGDVLNRP